jgi:CRP-like cAMP-binding protein
VTIPAASILDLLKTKSVIGPLPDTVLSELIVRARTAKFAKGAAVYRRGDASDSLLIIVSGRIKIFNVATNAREIVLNVLGPGDLVGELGALDGQPRSADAAALEACEGLLFLRRDILPALESHPKAMLQVVVALSKKLRQLSAMAEAGLLQMASKAASGLLVLANQHGRPVDGGMLIDVRLSQRDLGNYIGLSRENTSRELGRLKDEGLIRIDGALITILDMNALREFAEIEFD